MDKEGCSNSSEGIRLGCEGGRNNNRRGKGEAS